MEKIAFKTIKTNEKFNKNLINLLNNIERKNVIKIFWKIKHYVNVCHMFGLKI